MDKYAIDVTSAFFARFAGSFVAGTVLMQFYILYRGTEGTWAFFNFLFITLLLIALKEMFRVSVTLISIMLS